MKPKVLFAYRFGVLGGVATQLINRYAAFSSRYDVRVLFEQDDGVTGHFPPGSAVALADAAERVEYLRETAPDLIVIIDAPSIIKDWQQAGRGGAAVVEVHTTTANFAYLSRLDVDAGISGIVTVSEYMAGLVRETAIGSNVPVRIVSNCLDDRWFQPRSVHQTATAAPIAWVGKLDGHKRALTALSVLERIVVELSGEVEVAPVLIGGYAAGADRIRHVLSTIANRPVLRQYVEWLPRVDYSMMPTVLRNAGQAGGISLSTSQNESFGMSVAESLASGCRVVAPNVGALAEIVPQEMLYPDRDYEAAISLACEMLRNSELHRDTTAQAAARLRTRMTPASTLAQFTQALADFGLVL